MTGLLTEWVARHASDRPEATAVVMGAERLSYRELESRTLQLAQALRSAGCERGDRVCLALPKSPAAVVAILACLEAVCAYLPLDYNSTQSRIARILQSCEPALVLATHPAARFLVQVLGELGAPKLRVGWLDDAGANGNLDAAFHAADLAAQPTRRLHQANTPHDPAYVFFTSGSTGEPKGVVISHHNVRTFVDWAVPYFGMQPGERISGHPPLHFDLSVFDLFGALAAGCELHLVPPDLNLSAQALVEFIRTSRLHQWFSVPSILNYLAKFEVVRQGDFPDLRRLLWCGEVLPTPALIHWMERLPHARFTNLYGPTEATIASSYYTVPAVPQDPRAEIPIGTACAGESLHVLDSGLRPVATGAIGDLYLGGEGLSSGYWRDPQKTAAAFVQVGCQRLYKTGDLARLDAEGLCYFVGRADSQIKCRGYRIELGEIEAALHANPRLRESAVVAVPTDGFEGNLICCAYATFDGAAEPPARVRSALTRLVPGYMLPSRWLQMSQLPKNQNGKVDRKALREAFTETVLA
jgi:amino acid adenylation domain-containing protein